jgi:hypothetical protein
MEIPRIEETSQAVANEEIRLRKASGRACIYYPEVICTAPKLQFKICRSCPRCAKFIQNNVVRSVFDHIKSLAISLLERMDVQFSK